MLEPLATPEALQLPLTIDTGNWMQPTSSALNGEQALFHYDTAMKDLLKSAGVNFTEVLVYVLDVAIEL